MKQYLVDRGQLRQNIEVVKARAGGTPIYGVLKGEGYGLGLLELARALREAEITRFAVTEAEDAVTLREAGFQSEEILMLRATSDPETLGLLVDHHVVCTIGSMEDAVALSNHACARGTVAEAHVKIDTGMGRYGFLPEEWDKAASVYQMPGLALTGIYTHFYAAFGKEKTVQAQMAAFDSTLSRLRGAGLDVGTVHAANSICLFRFSFGRYDAVRVGSAFTGRLSAGGKKTGLIPLGCIRSEITEIRWLPKGHTIGYGASYTTRRPTRIAVIPVGYCDGYCMEKMRDTYTFKATVLAVLSAIKAWLTHRRLTVAIGGKRARVLGHVGMSHTVCDVTDLPCQVGDGVTLPASPLMCQGLPRAYQE